MSNIDVLSLSVLSRELCQHLSNNLVVLFQNNKENEEHNCKVKRSSECDEFIETGKKE